MKLIIQLIKNKSDNNIFQIFLFITFSLFSHNVFADELESMHIIDWHVHVAGLGYGNSGAFINEQMKKNFRFKYFLKWMDVTEDELKQHGDQVMVKKLNQKINESRYIDQAVVLAMDGVIDKASGELDLKNTQVFVPNDYVARETSRYPNLLFGASINPNRKNAIKLLEQVVAEGAVLIKWIPSIMHIDPSDISFIPFYSKMAELNIPLLTHTGMEKSFASARDDLADPVKLSLPLLVGVTVIAAHIATTGESRGEDNFERILPMLKNFSNLYTDISSLTQINKLGYLARALKVPGLKGRMIYGTDWPLQSFPLVSPWYHVNHIGFKNAWEISGIENKWDRDIKLKQFIGVPNEVFNRRAGLLKNNIH